MIRNIVFTESLVRETPKTPDCSLCGQSNAPDGAAYDAAKPRHSSDFRSLYSRVLGKACLECGEAYLVSVTEKTLLAYRALTLEAFRYY